MGQTKIQANLDRNVVSGQYVRLIDLGENNQPTDITIKLLHQYETPQYTLEEITIASNLIPANYLTTSDGLYGTTSFEQTCSFSFANPTYVKDLFIQIMEVRNQDIVTTRVPVIDSTEDFPVEPKQPIKYPDYEENVPPTPAIEYVDNISIPVPQAQSVLFDLAVDPLTLEQASKRVWFEKGETSDDDTWLTQNYNQSVEDRYFIENAIVNYLPNPEFVASTEDANLPASYEVYSPGLVVNSNLLVGDIDGTSIWQLRASNVNPFNAFDTVKVSLGEPVEIASGLSNLTVSLYHQLVSDTGVLPFSQFNLNIHFYNITNDLLFTKTITIAATIQDRWEKLYGSVEASEIPLTAVRFNFELELPDIDATDLFQLQLYLPQAEAAPVPTTRALPDRIQDKYITPEIEMTLPLDFRLQTYHSQGAGRRGLVSSTTDRKDGFQWLASSERLRFMLFDAQGSCTLNIASDPMSIAEGTEVVYGIFLDGVSVEFFVNGDLLSSHTATYDLDQTAELVVGSLEASNTTINARLLDFKVLRS